MLRRCSKCKKFKSLDKFYKDKSKVSGVTSHCKMCKDKYIKVHQAGRKRNSVYDYDKRLRVKYDLTLKDYNRMLEQQKGLCAICKQPETCIQSGKVRRLTVDHNHLTGKVRGLLCIICNTKLGVLENREFVDNAIDYIKDYDT